MWQLMHNHLKTPIKVTLIYSNSKKMTRTFKSEQDLQWFIHNEGDHLLEIIRACPD